MAQWTAALHDGDRRWPFNERVQADARMEQVLLDELQGPQGWEWQTLRPGHVWLTWPAAMAAVECEPFADIAAIASETFPRYAATSPCDRCGDHAPIYGGLVMAAGAVLVGALVCIGCAAELEAATEGQVTWTWRRKE